MSNRTSGPARAWVVLGIAVAFISLVSPSAFGVERGPQETIKMRVVAVNPSDTKTRNIPVKVYLPEEVTPAAIVSNSGLDIEFDSEKSQYYAFSNGIELGPKQTRIFEIEIQDVWIVPQKQIDGFKEQATFVVQKLQGTEYYDSSKQLSDAITQSLNIIEQTQYDDTISKKRHIGVFRSNLKIVDQVREDIATIERLLTLASSLPIPETLEQTQIKSESPSQRTTWIIIFVIMLFIGLLAAVFFFTWHTQSRLTKEILAAGRDEAFGSSGMPTGPEQGKETK